MDKFLSPSFPHAEQGIIVLYNYLILVFLCKRRRCKQYEREVSDFWDKEPHNKTTFFWGSNTKSIAKHTRSVSAFLIGSSSYLVATPLQIRDPKSTIRRIDFNYRSTIIWHKERKDLVSKWKHIYFPNHKQELRFGLYHRLYSVLYQYPGNLSFNKKQFKTSTWRRLFFLSTKWSSRITYRMWSDLLIDATQLGKRKL